MTRVREFAHVIVGAGQAASVLAAGLPSDESVALIEADDVGGSCVNTGCTPTKTLVASARVAHLARRARDYGVITDGVRIDYGRVHARMDALRTTIRDDLADWYEGLEGCTLLRGRARFVAERTLQVGDALVRGDRVYIDVGSRAHVPDIDGLGEVPWLDNDRILDLRELPERLLVLGGSYVGLEFAQVFARFGSDVTVVTRSDRVVPREDEDVCAAVQEALEAEGITFHLERTIERVRGLPGGVEASLSAGAGSVRASHLLLATGRVPRTDDLGLDAAGIDVDEEGYVRVDERLETSCEGVFALGDVNGHSAFTHTSVHDGEIVLDVVRGGSRTVAERVPVSAMFVDPPLGRVGMTEREAVERGHRVLRAVRPMTSVNRAREMGETRGLMKLLVDADDDRILGAVVYGVHGDEAIDLMSAVMHAGVRAHDFRRAVLVHPTVGELLPFLVDALEPLDRA